jgi:hypothetical protein
MIKFFRRIRKQLADDNKPLKYARYAIGEIALVVIGILIALSINNWNEDRKSKEMEHKMLKELYSTNVLNIKDLERGIEMTSEAKKSCDLLIAHLTKNLDYNDSLDQHFSKAIFWFKSVPDRSAFETSKNYGLHIFRNDSLRILTSFLYESRMDWISTKEKRNHDFYFNTVSSIVLRLFDSVVLWSEMKPLNYAELHNQSDYLSLLRTLRHERNKDISWFEQIRDQLLDLKIIINAELEIKNNERLTIGYN